MSIAPQVKAELSASSVITVNPKKSHVLLIALCGLAALFAVGSGIFFFLEKNTPAFIFLGLTVADLVAIYGGYLISHKDQDRAGATVNVEQTNEEGKIQTRMSMDIRSIADVEAASKFLAWIQRVFDRKPLPVAQGMLDERMQPIEGTEAQAQAAVETTNLEAQRQVDAVAALARPGPPMPDTTGMILPQDGLAPQLPSSANEIASPSEPNPTTGNSQ